VAKKFWVQALNSPVRSRHYIAPGQGALRIPTKIKLELKPRLEEREFNGVCIDYFEPKINVKQQSLPVL
jgi:hypothetical protein